MLSAVCVGTNNLAEAAQFYDTVLAEVDMVRLFENDIEVGYGTAGTQETTFWVLLPFNKKPATFGNGTQIMFKATSHEAVQAFHAAAITSGGKDEGLPGNRDYSEGYYGTYVRDLDGNKLHVFYLPTPM